jgi:polysaccharide export outer membrane protein
MFAGMLPAIRRSSLLLAVILAAAWLPGCASSGRKHEARKVPDRGEIDPEQARELDKVTMPQYVVEPPDELEIAIKPPPEDWTTSTVTVQQDGLIDLGLLGDVYVVGATLPEVESRIAQRLGELAVRSGKRPQPYRVSARLTNSQSKYYYVMGAVATQGRVPIKGNETVLDAILQAGLKSNSLPEKAYLVRPHPPGTPDQVLKIDWCGIRERGDTLTNYQLFPGDRVVVPGTRPPGVIATLLGR